MRTRHNLLLILAILAGLVASTAWEASRSSAQQNASGAQIADLREQLESGLKARVPADFAFIDTVVQMVEAEELPLELVKSTFQWVRQKRGNKKYLVPYFNQALRLRAAKLGIEIE